MKHLNEFLLILWGGVILLSFSVAEGQIPDCPPWATNSQTFTKEIDGCDYIFEVCWKCPVLGDDVQWVTIKPPTKVDQSCVNGLTPGQAYDAILDTLNNDPYWFIQLCTGDIPPCGVDTWKVGTRIYNCWRMYNNGSTIEYQQCDWNSYCEQIWEICWIQGTGPQKTLIQDWTQVGTPACNNPMPPVPGAGQTSACWNEHICQ